MNDPLVSIVIPTFNRASFLPRAIASVEAQTFSDWEIVLVDDGSTDDTVLLMSKYAARPGSRIQYIRQSHAGVGAARNRGIEAARGRFIAFLDSDDEYLPQKLERQLTLFQLRPDLGLVYSDYAFVDVDGQRHESVFNTLGRLAREVPCEEAAPGLYVCQGSLFDTLIRGYFIATIVGMVRREVLNYRAQSRATNPSPKRQRGVKAPVTCAPGSEKRRVVAHRRVGSTIRFPVDLSYAEEWLFYLKVAQVCEAGFVDEPLCLHHAVDGSLARTDRQRNTLRYRELLRAMRTSLPGLNRRHRRIIAANLAATSLQLGYDAFKAGRFGQAQRHFFESFVSKPCLHTLLDLLHSVACSLTRRSGRASLPGPQDGLKPVR
jgi:glycosyltransferase involved in cell wall biosynthesis